MRKKDFRGGGKGFSLTELLICIGVMLALLSGLSGLQKPEPSVNVAHKDMDRLDQWLESAMLRADRWKKDFYLLIIAPSASAERHRMKLQWLNRRESVLLKTETFYADERVRWKLQEAASGHTYSWNVHTLSPAFTISALSAEKANTGEKITLSVRGLATRVCACDRR